MTDNTSGFSQGGFDVGSIGSDDGLQGNGGCDDDGSLEVHGSVEREREIGEGDKWMILIDVFSFLD